MQKKDGRKRIRARLIPALLAGLFFVCAQPAQADGEPADTPAAFDPAFCPGTVETYQGLPVAAEALRGHFACTGELTLSYLKEPDWNTCGYQGAAVLVKDGAGHSFAQPFTVLVRKDREPPVLHGVKKLNAYLDEGVVYMNGVWAEDNADSDPAITVDTSKVNYRAAGTYSIVYTATDYSGNSVREKTEITLIQPKYTEEDVHKQAQNVLAKITTPEMTVTEKLQAIYHWGRTTVKYGRGVGHKDWRLAAVTGFKKKRGDCFVFYATSRALLEEIGVEYRSVERIGGQTRHYWLLVNVGTGWYHFDTTYQVHHKQDCFMMTDEQCQILPAFWRYDKSLQPPVAEEPFDYEAQVAKEKAAAEPVTALG